MVDQSIDYDKFFAAVPAPGETPAALAPSPASPASASPKGGFDYDQYFSTVPSPGEDSAAPPNDNSASTVTPNPWWYAAGKALTGLMGGSNTPAYIPGVMVDPSLYTAPTPTEADANKLVFGKENVKAPGPVSEFAGGAAHALAADPSQSLLFPAATLGGALGGQAGAQSGIPGAATVGGLAGGLAGGLGEAALASSKGVDAIKSVADKLGSAASPQEAGQHLLAGARDWVNSKIPALEDAVWNPFHRTMAAGGKTPDVNSNLMADFGLGSRNTDTPVENYLSTLDDLSNSNKLGPLAESGKTLRSPLIDRLMNSAKKGGILPGEDEEGNALEPQIPSFTNVKNFRSQVGDAMVNPKNPLFDLPQAQKSAIYGSLSDDLKATAEKNGLGKEFEQANTTTSQLRTHATQYLQPFMHDDVTPEAAAGIALKNSTGRAGGGTNLAQLRSVMPEAVDQLASSVLRSSPSDFVKMAPEAQRALIPDPGMRKQVLDALSVQLQAPKVPAAVLAAHGIGGAAGGLALNALAAHLGQGVSPELAASLGTLGSEALPFAKAGLGYLSRNPTVPAQGALGALTGQNALLPPGPR